MYHSSVPRPRRLLPRPCPKCGNVYGTTQTIIFNDRYHTGGSHYYRSNNPLTLRVIIRIRHPDHRSKPCNFMVHANPEFLDYCSRFLNTHSMRSKTLRFSEKAREGVRQFGWSMRPKHSSPYSAHTKFIS